MTRDLDLSAGLACMELIYLDSSTEKCPESTSVFHIREPYPTNFQLPNALMQVYLYQFRYRRYVHLGVCFIFAKKSNAEGRATYNRLWRAKKGPSHTLLAFVAS